MPAPPRFINIFSRVAHNTGFHDDDSFLSPLTRNIMSAMASRRRRLLARFFNIAMLAETSQIRKIAEEAESIRFSIR